MRPLHGVKCLDDTSHKTSSNPGHAQQQEDINHSLTVIATAEQPVPFLSFDVFIHFEIDSTALWWPTSLSILAIVLM